MSKIVEGGMRTNTKQEVYTDLEFDEENLRKSSAKWYTESFIAKDLLKEALDFMNLVPNKKYGDNYSICARISEFLKKTEE